MSYQLGTKSKERLERLHPKAAEVVELAISRTDIDFSVIETIRSEEQQQKNIEDGVSWSMRSYHLPVDGVSLAVDIYPWVNGQTSHEVEHYKRVAKAMFSAAQDLEVYVEWGGFWYIKHQDMPHWEFTKIKV